MRRNKIFSALTLVVSCLLCALSLEIFVRVAIDDGMQYDLEMWKYARDLKRVANDPRIGHEHVPNSAEHLMGVDVSINSKGLRDREFSYQRDPAKRRILMLGDSITEGWGVPVDKTFAKRIEQLSATRGKPMEVINAGVGNYNTIMEVEYFLQGGYKFQPDVVVLNYFINDAEPVPPHPTVNFLRGHCESCIFLNSSLDAVMRWCSLRPDWSRYYSDLYDHGNARGWLDAKDSIRKLAEYCKLHNFKLLIANIPELHDVNHYPFGEISNLLARTASENAVEFVDLVPALASTDSTSLWVSRGDQHPNAYAHDLMARALFSKLETMP